MTGSVLVTLAQAEACTREVHKKNQETKNSAYISRNFSIVSNPQEQAAFPDLVCLIQNLVYSSKEKESVSLAKRTLDTLQRLAAEQQPSEEKKFLEKIFKVAMSTIKSREIDETVQQRAKTIQNELSLLICAKQRILMSSECTMIERENFEKIFKKGFSANSAEEIAFICKWSACRANIIKNNKSKNYILLSSQQIEELESFKRSSHLGVKEFSIELLKLNKEIKEDNEKLSKIRNRFEKFKNESKVAEKLLNKSENESKIGENFFNNKFNSVNSENQISDTPTNKDFLMNYFEPFLEMEVTALIGAHAVHSEEAKFENWNKRQQIYNKFIQQEREINCIYKLLSHELDILQKYSKNKISFMKEYRKNSYRSYYKDPGCAWEIADILQSPLLSVREFETYISTYSGRSHSAAPQAEIEPTSLKRQETAKKRPGNGSNRAKQKTPSRQARKKTTQEKPVLSEDKVEKEIEQEKSVEAKNEPVLNTNDKVSPKIFQALDQRPPFEEYAPRITLWFEDPEQALGNLKYQPLSQATRDKQYANHTFPMVIDRLISNYGVESKWNNPTTGREDMLYCIPAEWGNERGFFQFAVDPDGICYHRYFGRRSNSEFIDEIVNQKKIWSWNKIDDYPTLQQASLIEKTKKSQPVIHKIEDVPMTIDPVYEYITMMHPSGTIKLFKCGK